MSILSNKKIEWGAITLRRHGVQIQELAKATDMTLSE